MREFSELLRLIFFQFVIPLNYHGNKTIIMFPVYHLENIRRFIGSLQKRAGWVFQLKDVPGRKNIQIHIGNKASHILGCILLGERIERLKGKAAVLQSGVAFKEFMKLLKGETEIEVNIINCF